MTTSPARQRGGNAPEQVRGCSGDWAGRPLGRERRIQMPVPVRRAAAVGGGGLWLNYIFVFGEVVGHGRKCYFLHKVCLEEAEDSLDDHPGRNGAACGILCRHKFPAANGLLGAFIKPQADSLNDTDLRGAPVDANQNLQRHLSL